MALNIYMHPRNIFRHHRPDFTSLADKYEFLGQLVTRDERGRAVVDLHDAKSLAALTRSLLLEHWQLNLNVPPNTLVPTVPLRLNYLLWLEDILSINQKYFASKYPQGGAVNILDIGCGASCIYPLLGVKMQPNWRFVATESDSFNLQIARENIAVNNLQESIQVTQSNADYSDGLLSSALRLQSHFHLCMCNPPFFSDPRESISRTRDLEARDQPPSAGSSAIQQYEAYTRGGEVAFISQLIVESIENPSSIWILTAMLGKKKSLSPLKHLLTMKKVHNYAVHEMCQGRVMRWGLVWTVDPQVTFPVSPFHAAKLRERPPICWTVPCDLKCLTAYNPFSIFKKLEDLFTDLKIPFLEQKSKICEGGGIHLLIFPTENTWSHSRRKRREMKRNSAESSTNSECLISRESVEMEVDSAHFKSNQNEKHMASGQNNDSVDAMAPEAKRRKLELEEHIHSEGAEAWAGVVETSSITKSNLFKATVWVKVVTQKSAAGDGEVDVPAVDKMSQYQIQMKLESGEDREAMNQIMLHIRNKMT